MATAACVDSPLVSLHVRSNVKAIQRLNEAEARLGTKDKLSWHAQYKDSAYIFVGKRCTPLVSLFIAHSPCLPSKNDKQISLFRVVFLDSHWNDTVSLCRWIGLQVD